MIGKKLWAIAEGYIPPYSVTSGRELVSHETICILNANDQDAHIKITIYFSDKDPVGPYNEIVPAKRTKHIRFNELTTPQPIPHGIDYSSVIESDLNVVVQHTRLDARSSDIALITTIAFSGDQ